MKYFLLAACIFLTVLSHIQNVQMMHPSSDFCCPCPDGEACCDGYLCENGVSYCCTLCCKYGSEICNSGINGPVCEPHDDGYCPEQPDGHCTAGPVSCLSPAQQCCAVTYEQGCINTHGKACCSQCCDRHYESCSTPDCAIIPGSCEHPNAEDSCSFYNKCLDAQFQCGPEGYPLGFGLHYCEIFLQMQSLECVSQAGNNWMQFVRQCLQDKLAPLLNAQPQPTCEEVEKFAFESHPDCYVTEDSRLNICNLPGTAAEVGYVARKGLASYNGFAQILTILGRCSVSWGHSLWYKFMDSVMVVFGPTYEPINDIPEEYSIPAAESFGTFLSDCYRLLRLGKLENDSQSQVEYVQRAFVPISYIYGNYSLAMQQLDVPSWECIFSRTATWLVTGEYILNGTIVYHQLVAIEPLLDWLDSQCGTNSGYGDSESCGWALGNFTGIIQYATQADKCITAINKKLS